MPENTPSIQEMTTFQETGHAGIRAYHFIPQSRWRRILESDSLLRPSNPLVRAKPGIKLNLPQDAWNPYLFCFMGSPRPASWLRNKSLPFPYNTTDTWRPLMASVLTNNPADIKLVAVQFDVSSQDHAYVVDYWQIEKPTLDVTKGRLSSEEAEALGWTNYYYSKVPLQDYKRDYIFPELIIASPINLDRVMVVGSVNSKLRYRTISRK